MERTHTVVDSPVGPLTLVACEGVLSGLYMTQQRYRPDEALFGVSDASGFGRVCEQLEAYFGGELTEFDVPLHFEGTAFQQRVWRALCGIPYGRTVTYGWLAESLGNPKASRAVGLANGKNPIGVVVPCHRVVGSDGSLTGYGGGLPRKRALLDLERRVAGVTLV